MMVIMPTFFKRSWEVTNDDSTNAVLKFFNSNELYKPIKCTFVTLIIKIKYPLIVKDFLSIAYCTILYKVISKILTNMLWLVMDSLIDQSQFAFVPERVIIDNIILSKELIKRYGRRGISQRYMIKIDLQKAYDSVEWVFVELIQHGLHFSTKFISWIILCMTTVSYSLTTSIKPSYLYSQERVLIKGPHVPSPIYISHGVPR